MPTIVRGWAPKMLNTNAARAELKSPSFIPKNSPVRRYMSSVKARAGSKLVKALLSAMPTSGQDRS